MKPTKAWAVFDALGRIPTEHNYGTLAISKTKHNGMKLVQRGEKLERVNIKKVRHVR